MHRQGSDKSDKASETLKAKVMGSVCSGGIIGLCGPTTCNHLLVLGPPWTSSCGAGCFVKLIRRFRRVCTLRVFLIAPPSSRLITTRARFGENLQKRSFLRSKPLSLSFYVTGGRMNSKGEQLLSDNSSLRMRSYRVIDRRHMMLDGCCAK